MKTPSGGRRGPSSAGRMSGTGVAVPAVRADSIAEPDGAGRRALLEVLARAFRDNPMNRAIHGPSSRRRVRANRAGLRALVLDGCDPAGGEGIHTRIFQAGDGVVRGGFIALAPGRSALPPPRTRRQIGCFWHQGLGAMERWSEVHFKLGQLRPIEPHWYLAVLGVDPRFWGQGVGSRLLAELFRLAGAPAGGAERAAEPPGRAPIYLESDREQSIRFYRARGFEWRAECRVLGVRCLGLGRGFPDAAADSCDPVRVEPRERPVSPPLSVPSAWAPHPGDSA